MSIQEHRTTHIRRCRIRHHIIHLLIASMIVALVGCEDLGVPNSAQSARQSKPNKDIDGFIVFMGASEDDPLWRPLRASAERFCATMGSFELKVAAPTISEANAQAALINQLRCPEMRGLCIVPADLIIMKEVLEEVRSAGIAVVTIMQRPESRDKFMFVGLDQMAIGRAMADTVFDALDGKGTIALMHGSGTGQEESDRYFGFKERVSQLPAIAVLRELDCEGNEFVAGRLVRGLPRTLPSARRVRLRWQLAIAGDRTRSQSRARHMQTRNIWSVSSVLAKNRRRKLLCTYWRRLWPVG